MRAVRLVSLLSEYGMVVCGLALAMAVLSGCVVGPGLSLHVNEHVTLASKGKYSNEPLVARQGDVVVSNQPVFKVDAFRLESVFEGKVPGTFGVNFDVRIDPCWLVLSYQDERWLYYVAESGCVAAWYSGTSVFSANDEAGIRVSKSGSKPMEWFVDNSRYNGLPERGYARWHRKVSASEAENLTKDEYVFGRSRDRTKWVRFDGESSGVWSFSFYDTGDGFRDRQIIEVEVGFPAIVSVERAAIRILAGDEKGLKYEVVSDFEGNRIASGSATGSSQAGGTGSGTCFAVSAEGLILTAHHVVENAISIHVIFEGGERMNAELVGASPASDLALLKVGSPTKRFLTLAPSRSARLGQRVFTVGYPATQILGSEPKYSEGTISGLSGYRGEATLLQVSVPVQPGNSGGALLNESGEVLGVITSGAAAMGFFRATGSLPQNVNWAVKSELASALFDQPVVPSELQSRDQAIALAREATCLIVVEKTAAESVR